MNSKIFTKYIHAILLSSFLCIFHLFLAVPAAAESASDSSFISVSGSLGLGFYDVPNSATKGGVNFKADIIPVSLPWFHIGFSSGILNLVNSTIEGSETQKAAYPLGIVLAKYFINKSWNCYPYVQLTPALFLLNNSINNQTDISAGFGGFTGMGIIIPIASELLYIDLSIAFCWFHADGTGYGLLTNSLGITLKF
ncbi:MAG: hypothetical protein GY754_43895 [bacterium]|nr:hypothetical protein [bacterium]